MVYSIHVAESNWTSQVLWAKQSLTHQDGTRHIVSIQGYRDEVAPMVVVVCRCQMDHHKYANLVADFKTQTVAFFGILSCLQRKLEKKKNIVESTRNDCILLGPK